MAIRTTPEVVVEPATQASGDATSAGMRSSCSPAGVDAGEVAIEIAPLVDVSDGDDKLARSVAMLLRRTSLIARALTGAEQSALSLSTDGDPANARKYFSLSGEYESYRNFRLNPRGYGLHGMKSPRRGRAAHPGRGRQSSAVAELRVDRGSASADARLARVEHRWRGRPDLRPPPAHRREPRT